MRQFLEIAHHSNGWATLYWPNRRDATNLGREKFGAMINEAKDAIGIRRGPHAPPLHNRERGYWAIPPEYARRWSAEGLATIFRDTWQRHGVQLEIETLYMDTPFVEAGALV